MKATALPSPGRQSQRQPQNENEGLTGITGMALVRKSLSGELVTPAATVSGHFRLPSDPAGPITSVTITTIYRVLRPCQPLLRLTG